jgi:hypothetical protein
MQFGVLLSGQKYMLNPDLDTIDVSCEGSWVQAWSPRWQTQLTATFAHDETLETELVESGILANRVERFRYGTGANAVYALSERWSLTGGLGARLNQYPGNQNPDLRLFHGSFGPEWKVHEKHTAGLVLGVSDADYENDTTDRTASASLFWKWNFAETGSLRVEGGYRSSQIDYIRLIQRIVPNPDGTFSIVVDRKEETDTDAGFVFSAALSKSWSDRLSSSLSLGREHYNGTDATSYERSYIRSGLRFRLTERTSARAELGYDLTSQTGTTGQDDHYFRASPSIDYQLTERIRVSLGGAYEHVLEDQDAGSGGRDRFRTWVSFSTEWPRFWASH